MAIKRNYDEYESRIRDSLAAAWKFFERYKRPRTKADWDLIAVGMGDYRDIFTSDLIICVVDELEREYAHSMGRKETV